MKIALQLWTVRDVAERDMLGALRGVAALGYRAVEFAGLGNASARAVRQTLDERGLQAASAHVPLADLTNRLPQVIAQMQTLGCTQVVLPWIPPEHRTSLERVQQLAEMCNNLGANLAAAGIRFAYHNEDYDFAPLEHTTTWHALVQHTDPQLVALQLDIFTTALMHVDPLVLLRDHSQRVTSVHVCDLREHAYVPIGTGTFNWPKILEAVSATASEWLIVEQDGSPQSLEDAATSFAHLRGFLND